ncbi:MAG: hypothetical protein R2712_28835 [Vicinamibacterales bacterium]
MLALNARWRTLSDLAGALWLDQSAPCGWLVLERLALLAFGPDERAARAVPTLFGLGTLAAAVWIGRRWLGPLGAVVLSAACATGTWLVFFTLELKHYSADACLALLLPAIAAWTTEADREDARRSRVAAFWGIAAAGLWFSNGAVFVAPGCAVVVVFSAWRHDGVRGASRAAAFGVVWLASLGLDYWFVLRHALGNAYLANYWSFAFPPPGGGLSGALGWIQHVVATFPVKPGGSELSPLFSLLVAAGVIHGVRRVGALGAAYALVPAAAIALGLLGIVPPFERLGIWVVPALYVSLALAADLAVHLLRTGWRARPARVGLGLVLLAASVVTTVDVVRNGLRELGVRSENNNYGLDDRRATRRVLDLLEPGDPVLTTHFGLAGLWWYAGENPGGPRRGAFLTDSPLYEMSFASDPRTCRTAGADTTAVLEAAGRAVIYLGFRLNVLPEGFDAFVLDDLARRGRLVGYSTYADLSDVAAFDFTQAPDPRDAAWLRTARPRLGPPLAGCLVLRPAGRW